MTHPRHSISKTYLVWVRGQISNSALDAWRNGINLDGKYTLPAQVTTLKHQENHTLLEVVLTEGRNRQIRRVATQLGYPVADLHRIRIGDISIEGNSSIEIGAHRELRLIELQSLQSGATAKSFQPS